MSNLKREYFNDYYYFLLEENGDNIVLQYSIYDTISESKKTNTKKTFKKDKKSDVEKFLKNVLKLDKKISKKTIEKKLTDIEKNGEIDELVDSDGTMLSSKIPYLNMYLHPKKTMDQTVVAARISNDPVTRGYRVYYGESKEKNDDVLSEINMEDAFGYEETKDKDMKGTLKQLEKMGIEDPVNKLERARKLGKRKDTKVVKNKKGEKVIKNLNLFEKQTLDEIKRQKMIKMVEDIISKKEKGDSDIVKKDNAISRILSKNLESIKKLAEKEGISLNKLINILRKGE
jgi:hypothetical protein